MSARSLNKVLLIGNLTRDPELRYTPSGTAVCTFGLATNRSWTPTDGGERQEETEYHRIVAWSKLAEICSQLLYKGRKVYVEGRLQTRTWQAQDGQERTATEVVIDNMIALGAPKNAGGEDSMEYGGDYAGSMGVAPARGMATVADDQAMVNDPATHSTSSAPVDSVQPLSTDSGQVADDQDEPEEAELPEEADDTASSKKKKVSGKATDIADDIPF